jgi:hypothetical protein
MDVVQWFTNSMPPIAAVCYGYVAKYIGAEHPDVFSAVFEYPNHMVTWTLDYGTSYEDGRSITFLGDKATMILQERGFRVVPTGRRGTETFWRPDITPIVDETAQMTAADACPELFRFHQVTKGSELPSRDRSSSCSRSAPGKHGYGSENPRDAS